MTTLHHARLLEAACALEGRLRLMIREEPRLYGTPPDRPHIRACWQRSLDWRLARLERCRVRAMARLERRQAAFEKVKGE